MARDPGSVWSPLPEAGAPDGYVKTQFIVHSTGDNGTAAATRRFFEGVTPNESTFIVGQGPWDPTLQIMDSSDIADANGSANRRGISVEVAGDGVGGYNAWQRSEIIRIGLWAREEHPGILPRIIPSEPAPGFGWHVMFGAPGPWAAVAKSCPGKARIAELKADIFPAIFSGTPLSEEDDMANSDEILRYVQSIDHKLSVGSPTGDRIGDLWGLSIEIRSALVGHNDAGRNNFHWLADQMIAAVKTIPGAQVDEEQLRAAIASSVKLTEEGVAKALADEEDRRARDGDPATGPTS